MPTLNIGGHRVKVGEEFLSLSPEQQNSTVDEITKSLPQVGQQTSITDAVTDIPREIGRTADANLSAVEDNLSNRGANTSPFGFLNTGKAILGGLGLLASPVTGAARSLIGHPMAQAEHAVGTLINPQVAAHDDPQKMYETAAGDVETALSAARPSGFGPSGALAPGAIKVAPPTAAELKAAAKAVYNDPAIKGISIPPQDVSLLSSKIQSDLANQGFRPATGSAPGTFAEINRMVPPQGVTAANIDDLVAARRALGMTAKQLDPATFTATPDAAAAAKSLSHINDFLDTLAPELKTANANYAAGKSADRLDYRLAKAERRAKQSGIGGNLENTMRQEAGKIPDRGLTSDEQALRDQIALGTMPRNALRTLGKTGVDGGLSLLMHLGAGYSTGGATAPVAVAGTAARKIGEILTRRQMGQLSTMIRNRAPLATQNAAQQAVAQALMSRTPSLAEAGFPVKAVDQDTRKSELVKLLMARLGE